MIPEITLKKYQIETTINSKNALHRRHSFDERKRIISLPVGETARRAIVRSKKFEVLTSPTAATRRPLHEWRGQWMTKGHQISPQRGERALYSKSSPGSLCHLERL